MPKDSRGFPVNTLVKVDFEPHPLFFRILAIDHTRNFLQVRDFKSLSFVCFVCRLPCQHASSKSLLARDAVTRNVVAASPELEISGISQHQPPERDEPN